MSKYFFIISVCVLSIISCKLITNPDNDPPNVQILKPIAGSSVSEIVKVTAIASDNEGIRKLNLWVDGYHIQDTDDTQEPYEFLWNTVNYANKTEHMLTVRAFDVNDNITDSAPVKVIVDNTPAFPTRIEITNIEFKDNSFIITWTTSPDPDFASYKLYESDNELMGNKTLIFSTSNINQTEFTVVGIDENEVRYYQLGVTDTFGFETSSTIKAAGTEIPPTGLIAWYPFSGNVLDKSGNNNHGEVNGPILVSDRFGNPNSAYYFDGVDDYIQI
ncbi:hypothetical protein JW935_20990, partial [candidate division KSB1 bacterium]|nr:hypothetical protein [candidate division KSB1 bacterium]